MIEHGIVEGVFRKDIVPTIVLEGIYALYVSIVREKQYKLLSASTYEILQNTIAVYFRGFCTHKGITILDRHINQYNATQKALTQKILTQLSNAKDTSMKNDTSKFTGIKRMLLAMLCFLHHSCVSTKVQSRETVLYAVKDTTHVYLDKYVDNGVPYKGKRPVFIYVHGGGFATGSRINALQTQYCKHFAAAGFVVISIDYRLGLANNKQPDEEAVMKAVSLGYGDLIDATAFIISKANEWNIDTGKIIISGGIAGAVACLMAEYDICSGTVFRSLLPKGFNYAGVISHAGCIITRQDSLTWKKSTMSHAVNAWQRRLNLCHSIQNLLRAIFMQVQTTCITGL